MATRRDDLSVWSQIGEAEWRRAADYLSSALGETFTGAPTAASDVGGDVPNPDGSASDPSVVPARSRSPIVGRVARKHVTQLIAGSDPVALAALSTAAVLEGLAADSARVGRVERRRLAQIATLLARRVWEDDHTFSDASSYDDAKPTHRGAAHNMASWVSQNLGVSLHRAKRLVDAAVAIERLPKTSRALSDGSLSIDKVVELTRYVDVVTEGPEISWAKRVSVRTVKNRADERCRLDEDARTETRRDRYLQHYEIDDKLYLNAMYPVELGRPLMATISKLAESITPCPTGESSLSTVVDPSIWELGRQTGEGSEVDIGPDFVTEDLSPEQLQADALLELVLGGDGPSATKPVTAEVIVHTKLHGRGFGNGVDGSDVILSADTIERLTCDERLRFVLTDADGNAQGIGTASNVIPKWLRNAVLKSYEFTCTFPGCDTRRGLDVHHLVHWTNGGPTDSDNLAPMCRRHHTLLHEHRWRAFRGSKGTITWLRPDGSRYIPGPAPPSGYPRYFTYRL